MSFLHKTPRAYKNEKSASGLVDATELTDAEERLRNPHVDPREFGARVDSTGEAGSGTDDTEALENSIAAAIEQKRPLFIPGKMRTTGALKAAAGYFEVFGLGGQISQIVPDTSAYDAFTIGTGEPGNKRSGYARDFAIAGGNAEVAAAGVESVTGKAAFKPDGMSLFEVTNLQIHGSHDLGVDLVGNCFGTIFYDLRCEIDACRVGVNLRKGSESGNDLSFVNPWLCGEVAAMHLTGGATNFHHYGGQFTSGRSSSEDDDLRGTVILNKDYLTGSTSNDTRNVDLRNIDFEHSEHCWFIRSFGNVSCLVDNSTFLSNGTAPALGICKGTAFGNGRLTLIGNRLAGTFAEAKTNLLKIEGGTSGREITEIGTHGGEITANGVTVNVDDDSLSVLAQLPNAVGFSAGRTVLNGLLLRHNEEALQVSPDWGANWIYASDHKQTIASATTLTIPRGLNVAVITGTAEIKEIKPNEGQVVFLKFSSTAKLVVGNNLKIGATFSATADDAILLGCDGTNWYRAAVGAAN